MTRTQLKRQFDGVKKSILQKMDTLFDKAVNSGALNVSDHPQDSFLLTKIIMHSVLGELSESMKPLTGDAQKDAENLKLFL